ncbi:MAG TPA: DUF998 domain-containing protein [Candidatus Angelobacter sp.]|nr:DUF998 domain-containing protein [Candidatus Angelobacter sp.]
MTKRNFAPLSCWCGIATPILFVSIMTILGFLKPGHSPLTEPGSDVAVGWQYGWVMDANFVAFGLLVGIFAWGIYEIIRPLLHSLRALKIGTFFVFLSGAGMVNQGLNPTDIPGFPPSILHGLLHDVGFFVVFLSIVIGMSVLGRQLRKNHELRGLGSYSLVAAVVATGLILTLFYESNHMPELSGLFEQVLIAWSFAWYGIIGWRLRIGN